MKKIEDTNMNRRWNFLLSITIFQYLYCISLFYLTTPHPLLFSISNNNELISFSIINNFSNTILTIKIISIYANANMKIICISCNFSYEINMFIAIKYIPYLKNASEMKMAYMLYVTYRFVIHTNAYTFFFTFITSYGFIRFTTSRGTFSHSG